MPESIGRLLSEAVSKFKAHDLSYPREDAELLLAGLIHRSREYLLSYPEVELPDKTCTIFRTWAEKRTRHYPIQYLTGRQEFYGRDFHITPDVLVPRPETELLIDVSLKLLPPEKERVRILDVGTGSGCIAITLGCEVRRSQILATDISTGALKVAEKNRRHHRADNVTLIQCSTVRPLSLHLKWDLIVSNPPYVSTQELDLVSPGVLEFEPETALLAGPSGLEIYEEIFSLGRRLLEPSGFMVVEIGYQQAELVRALAHTLGWKNKAVHRDLAGIDRCLVFSL